ncbi:MAG: hypothetical protein ACD_33C00036G0006 [uncultured bacterium]|nr:MAG: hypothetical protein ACD_33C00036G0006 [uncultured bacterium]
MSKFNSFNQPKQGKQQTTTDESGEDNTASNVFTGDLPPTSDVSENSAAPTVTDQTAAASTSVNDNTVNNAAKQSNVQQTTTNNFKPVTKFEMALVAYLEVMGKTKIVNPEEGGKQQYGLWLTIQEILNSKDQQEFNNAWNTILNFTNKHKDDVFNENFIFRFPEYWTGSDKEFSNFRRLVYLIITSNNVSTRKKSLESINLEKTCETLSEMQKNKIFNFYL